MSERERDPISNTETTGHEWDGIKELDTPLPRWWLWTFYGCIAYALIITILYPAWPLISSATTGVLGHSTRGAVAEAIEAQEMANAPLATRIEGVELAAVGDDAELVRFATAGGAAVFRTWCAQCHGSGAAGVQAAGYPNLLDDDWLWGGTIEDIHLTISHGIRYEDDPDTRFGEMPAFAETLPAEDIDAAVAHVLAISGQEHDASLLERGAVVWEENCGFCHGDEGMGDPFQGAPNLTDAIWLYGGDAATIRLTLLNGRAGAMPAWTERLSEAEIRQVAFYVHSLGGGQ